MAIAELPLAVTQSQINLNIVGEGTRTSGIDRDLTIETRITDFIRERRNSSLKKSVKITKMTICASKVKKKKMLNNFSNN